MGKASIKSYQSGVVLSSVLYDDSGTRHSRHCVTAESTNMNQRAKLISSLGIFAFFIVMAAFAGMQSLRWLEAETPGFFVDDSHHISALSLPGWPDTGAPWPSAVTEVGQTRVKDPEHFYQLVRSQPRGKAVQYLTTGMGTVAAFEATPRVLTRNEFAILFPALLMNGLLAIGIALAVWRARSDNAQAQALVAAGITFGTLAISTVAAVGSGALARLQILAQPLSIAALIHLAAVFPTDMIRRSRSQAMFAIYAPFAALALAYQLIWPDTFGTGLLQGVTLVTMAGAAAFMTASSVLRLLPWNPIVVRRRAAIATTGMVAVGIVALLWAAATGLHWRAITTALLTCGSILPLTAAAAISAPTFFVLDRRLRSILTYGLAIPAIAVLYLGSVFLLRPQITAGPDFAATLPFALLNLALLFTISPVVRVVRNWVDRAFSPETYSTDRSLAKLNRGLSAARTTQTLVSNTLEVVRRTLQPEKAMVYLRGRGAGFPLFAYDDPEQRKLAVPSELAEKLEAGESVIRYHWEDGSGRQVPALLDRLTADILTPVYRGGSCVGVVALSAKKSKHPYNSRDMTFINGAADQIALALPNAAAQDKLDVLHKNLDELSESLRIQTNRTETLKAMNAELGEALAKLRETHHQLAQNQQNILRIERLASLSRLSVGLTREISGPISSVLNSLRGIAKIGREHAEIERDPAKQSEAIDEMMAHSQSAAAWLERAIAYLRSFQALGQGDNAADLDKPESFAVREAFNNVTQLLRARLDESGCKIEYTENPESLQLFGSRQRFTLVLVDLVSAAIQAYADGQASESNESSDASGGQISVEADLSTQGVCVRVVDWAGGLPAAAVPRLLEELGENEELGNRRGLWMAKNLIEEGFGGSLEAITNDDHTCFSAIFPSVFAKDGPMVPPPSLRKADTAS